MNMKIRAMAKGVKMNLNEFIETYKGKTVGNGNCVILYRQYIQDVWQLPPLEGLGETGGAEGLYHRYNTDVGPLSRRHLELIQYSMREQRPLPGDVVIFRATDTNRFGHVGIYVESSVGGDMLIFDQHGLGSARDEGARLTTWNMDRVLGWLRKRARNEACAATCLHSGIFDRRCDLVDSGP